MFLIKIPIVIIGIVVVSILLPESRSKSRLRVDLVGVFASSVGLVCVTYGRIEAETEPEPDCMIRNNSRSVRFIQGHP